MIYAYAVTDRSAGDVGCRGLEDKPVAAVAIGGLRVAISEHAEAFRPQPTPDMLWAHEAVVEHLLGHAAVVPIRFGTVLGDWPSLAAEIRADREHFGRALARVRGRVELAVRLGLPEPGPAKPRDGTGYLAVRAGRANEASLVLDPLEALAAESRRAASRGEVVKASYLVESPAVPRFASLVRALQEQNPEVALSCTGPWPPYSFVTEGKA